MEGKSLQKRMGRLYQTALFKTTKCRQLPGRQPIEHCKPRIAAITVHRDPTKNEVDNSSGLTCKAPSRTRGLFAVINRPPSAKRRVDRFEHFADLPGLLDDVEQFGVDLLHFRQDPFQIHSRDRHHLCFFPAVF